MNGTSIEYASGSGAPRALRRQVSASSAQEDRRSGRRRAGRSAFQASWGSIAGPLSGTPFLLPPLPCSETSTAVTSRPVGERSANPGSCAPLDQVFPVSKGSQREVVVVVDQRRGR